jgi:hypothetical protein
MVEFKRRNLDVVERERTEIKRVAGLKENREIGGLLPDRCLEK